MSDIKTQVEDLIGSIGDDTLITDSALSTAREIVNLTPEEKLHYFIEKSSSIVDGTVTQIENRNNITVWRGGIECTEVQAGMEERVTDSSSIFYPSNDSPIYVLDKTGVTIIPTPSDAPNNAYIYSITVPTVAQDTDVPLVGFPEGAEFLLIYGTALKCAQRLLSDVRNSFSSPPASPTLGSAGEISGLPSPPAIPSIEGITMSFSDVAPVYIKPTFTPPSFPTINSLVLPPPPTPPAVVLQSVGSISGVPTYEGPTVAPNFADADRWILTEEDDTMATVRLNEIAQRLTQYQLDIQEAGNKFTKENTEYQANIQAALQDAQMKEGKEARDLQLYQNEITKYQQEVTAELGKWQSNEYTKKMDEYIQKYTLGVNEYNSNMQNNLNLFNSDVQVYSTQFQKSVKDADLSLSQNEHLISKFTQELQKYSAEVSTKVSENQLKVDRQIKINNDKLTKYNADIQKYGSEMQKKQTDHQQILQEISTLNQVYATALSSYSQAVVPQKPQKEE